MKEEFVSKESRVQKEGRTHQSEEVEAEEAQRLLLLEEAEDVDGLSSTESSKNAGGSRVDAGASRPVGE